MDFGGDRLTESKLSTLFPKVFPRFCIPPDRICLEGDPTTSHTRYTYISLPIAVSSEAHVDTEVDETSAKRLCLPPANSAPKTFSLGISSMLNDLLGISDLLDRLKGSIRRPRAIVGFILASLGGVLHLSYPPTLEELQLYCEVIAISTQLERPLNELVVILTATFNAFRTIQPVPIDSPIPTLDALFAFVWTECDQNQVCLNLLAPLLSTKKDHVRLLKLIGSLASLNYERIVDYMHLRCISLPDVALNFGEPLSGSMLPDEATFATAPKVEPIVNQELEAFPLSKEIKLGNLVLKTFGPFSDVEPLPEHLVALKSSTDDGHGSQSRRLAHIEHLCATWPYFAKLMDSGLSEARSRVIELPFSHTAIHAILCALYGAVPVTLSEEDAVDIIVHGPQFGLYESMRPSGELNESHPLTTELCRDAWYRGFFHAKPSTIALLLTAAHNAGDSELIKVLFAFRVKWGLVKQEKEVSDALRSEIEAAIEKLR